jgi:hypothetical protein
MVSLNRSGGPRRSEDIDENLKHAMAVSSCRAR